tara:strand:+ start:9571 stop:10005 length:435 start_codon:yes stop_codon:yes gene_type:complete
MGRDVSGTKKVVPALSNIRGIGNNLAHYITRSLDIDRNQRMGMLSDEQIKSIEDSLKNIENSYPAFDLNRQKEMQKGKDSHVIETDLIVAKKQDIDLERILQSWRGTRHSLGLKVRGQRTRCTGRSGKVVGVRKSTLKPGTASK